MRKSKLFLLGMLGALLVFSLLLTGCNARGTGTWSVAFHTVHNFWGEADYEVTLTISRNGSWEYIGTRTPNLRAGQRNPSAHIGVASGTHIRWQGDNGELIDRNGRVFGDVVLLGRNAMRFSGGMSHASIMLSRR